MAYTYKTMDQMGDIKGKRVLLRIDMNVAIKDGRVLEDFRLRKAFPTINFLREKGAKVILIGHLESTETTSLTPVFNYLKNYFPIKFMRAATSDTDGAGDNFGDIVASELAAMQDGDIALLENLRTNPGEKKNDPEFAKRLASFADIYIDDAFSVAHRPHASIIGVPALLSGTSYAGFNLDDEVKKLSQAFDPAHFFVFILGGAKFDTKMPLVTKFLQNGPRGADTVFIGGALANDCYKAEGFNVGLSTVSDGSVDLKPIISNPRVLLPADVIVISGHETSASARTKLPKDVASDEKIMDAGPAALADLRKVIMGAKFILWNGPLGFYEGGFTESTFELAKMIALATEHGAHTIVGGGDTLATISNLKIEDKFSFVSTAGGAMLDFLANETLPGIEALEGKK